MKAVFSLLNNAAFQNFKYSFLCPLVKKSVVLVCYVVHSKLNSWQCIKQGNSEEAAWVEEGGLVEGLALELRSH